MVVISLSCSPNDAVLLVATVAAHEPGGQPDAMVLRQGGPHWQAAQEQHKGPRHHGTQPHPCHDGGRQGVQGGAPSLLAEDQRGLRARVRVERLSAMTPPYALA